jgi:hypothetical protein
MSLEKVILDLTEAVIELTEKMGSSAPASEEAPKTKARKPKTTEDDGEGEVQPKKARKTKAKTKAKAKPEPEDEDEDEEITEAQIREVGTKVIKLGGGAEFRAALEEFGASKTSELEEDEYEPVHEKLLEILEELEA